jgi:protein-disulfide isomerase
MNKTERNITKMNADSRNKWIGAAIAAVLIIAAAGYYFSTRDAQTASGQTGVMEEQALPDIVMGEADALVTIVEYASMTCPHCATFHLNTLPGIKEKYIDTGKAKLILREFPFDPRAAAAAMLARCAPQERFYPLIDVLFQRQNEWATADDPRPILLQTAKLAGFTQESFEACLKNQELLDNVRAVQEKAADDYGVSSTPTLFVNGEKHAGALSVEDLSKIIDEKL